MQLYLNPPNLGTRAAKIWFTQENKRIKKRDVVAFSKIFFLSHYSKDAPSILILCISKVEITIEDARANNDTSSTIHIKIEEFQPLNWLFSSLIPVCIYRDTKMTQSVKSLYFFFFCRSRIITTVWWMPEKEFWFLSLSLYFKSSSTTSIQWAIKITNDI